MDVCRYSFPRQGIGLDFSPHGPKMDVFFHWGMLVMGKGAIVC